jgi:hypothetical protein
LYRICASAPGNMASALNSSLYNHMQNCLHLQPQYKRAFQHLRKLHSAQCSSLAFGSQRRFFNKVYAKLKQIPVSNDVFAALTPSSHAQILRQPSASASRRVLVVDAKELARHSFVEGGSNTGALYYQCLQCRMVPFEFRAPGSLTQWPTQIIVG